MKYIRLLALAAEGGAKDPHAQPATSAGNSIPELFADRTGIAQVMMVGQQTAGAGFFLARAGLLDLDRRQTERGVAFVGVNVFGHGRSVKTSGDMSSPDC